MTAQLPANASSNASQEDPNLLKVAGSTDANQLASAIQNRYSEDPTLKLTLRTIGAAALNQATKSIIISNRHFAKRGFYATIYPCFNDVQKDITAIELSIRLVKI